MKKILTFPLMAWVCALMLMFQFESLFGQSPPPPPCNTPTSITGELNPCMSSSGFNYSVQGVLVGGPAGSAVWEIPEGGYQVLQADPFGQNKTIRWTTPGVKNIKVYQSGCSTYSKTLTVNVGNSALNAPSAIAGSNAPCLGTTGTYSVATGTNFVWRLIVPGGTVDTDNPITQNGNSISIQWVKRGLYILDVYQGDGTCKSPSSQMVIDVGPPNFMSVYTATATQCTGGSSLFSNPSYPGYTYAWSIIPASAGQVSSSGNQATITWGSTAGNYTVQLAVTNSCGTSTATRAITVVNSPATPTLALASPPLVSTGQSAVINISNYSRSNLYQFEPSGSYSISMNQNDVSFSTNSQGTYALTARLNDGQCLSPQSNVITISAINPSLGPSVSGVVETCVNVNNTYSVNNPLTTYAWRVAPGVAKLNGVVATASTMATGNSVNVEWLQGGPQMLQVFPQSVPSGQVLKSTVYEVNVHQPLDVTKISEIVGSTTVCLSGVAPPPGTTPPPSTPVRFPYSIRYNDNTTPAEASNLKTTWSVSGGGTVTNFQNWAAIDWTMPGNFVVTATVTNSCPSAPVTTKTLNVSTASYSTELPKSLSGLSVVPIGGPTNYMTPNGTVGSTYKWQTTGNIVGQDYANTNIYFLSLNSQYVTYLYNTGVCDVRPPIVYTNSTHLTQSISFPQITNPFAGNLVTLNATSTNPNIPVTFRSSDPTVASISGNQMQCLKSGTVTIYASQPGSLTYKPADDVFINLTITKQNQTITFPVIPPSCVGNKITLNASSTSGLPITYTSSSTAVATVSGSVVTVLTPGSINITASQSGNTNYNAAVNVVQGLVVNPLPTLTSTTTATQCDDLTTNIPLTSGIAGSTFTWTVYSTSNVTGASAGSGNIINQKLSLTNKSVGGNVVYAVVITSPASCVSATTMITVQVKPNPQVTNVDKTICSGQPTALSLTSSVASSTFSWSLKSQNNVTGASGPGTTASINQVLNAGSTTAGTAAYTITASNTGCTGTPKDITVMVNPVPQVTGNNVTICSNQTANIPLTPTIVGTSLSWTASPSNVTGASGGSGATISQLLSTVIGGYVTYSVTPTLNQCTGSVLAVTATVNPVATVSAADQTICSGQSILISPASNLSGTTFSWVVKSASNVTGAGSGSGSSIAQTLSTSTQAVGSVVYTITPIPSGSACPGSPIDVTVTVNPAPIANATNVTICSNQSTAIVLTSNPAGASFTWTSVLSGINSATGATTGSTIDQILTSSSGGTATYSVTPTLNGCTGNVKSVVATVKPIALVLGSDQSICSGQKTSVNLTSNLTTTYYLWSAKTINNVTGATIGSSYTGSPIAQTLAVASQAPGSVVYTVTPLPGAAACAGPSIDITVTVNPIPNVATLASQSICSGTALNTTPVVDVTGATYSWTSTATSNVTGTTPSGTGPIQDVLTNTSTTTGTATYMVVSKYLTCPGPAKSLVVTVKPKPVASISGTTLICGSNTPTLTAYPSGASYAWSSGQTTQSITVKNTGTYTVTVSGSNFCGSSQASVAMTSASAPSPTITIIANRLCQSGAYDPRAQIVTQTADSYRWSTGETSQYIYVSSPGTYSVTVTKNGCSASTSSYISCGSSARMATSQDLSDGVTAVPYPNPADDEVMVSVPVHDAYKISLVNSLGTIVNASVRQESPGVAAIDTRDLAAGVYIIRLSCLHPMEWKLAVSH